MTLRERIADWITGGKLADARNNFKAMEHALTKAWESSRDRQTRLDEIAAQETPGANATARRMARIARGEE